MTNYPSPVNQLLILGNVRGHDDWTDYLALGLRPEHIPELLCMAQDDDLHAAVGTSPEVWAPVHAWRALGQLRAEAAIEPLVSLLRRIDEDDDDWVGEDLPLVFGKIGPAAIPALNAYLANAINKLYARVAASYGLEQIGQQHPAARADCVTALCNTLTHYAQNSPTLNAFVVGALLNLKAQEAAPLMEHAYADRAVEIGIIGDWEDAQIELGVKARRDTPRPNYAAASLGQAQYDAINQDIANFKENFKLSKQQASTNKKRKRHQRKR